MVQKRVMPKFGMICRKDIDKLRNNYSGLKFIKKDLQINNGHYLDFLNFHGAICLTNNFVDGYYAALILYKKVRSKLGAIPKISLETLEKIDEDVLHDGNFVEDIVEGLIKDDTRINIDVVTSFETIFAGEKSFQDQSKLVAYSAYRLIERQLEVERAKKEDLVYWTKKRLQYAIENEQWDDAAFIKDLLEKQEAETQRI